MQILLTDVGKRFQVDWIFRRLSLSLGQNISYAILGPNGSGKSTLLQVISGHLTPTEGKIIIHTEDGRQIDPDSYYELVAIAAPYLELIEEFTLLELIDFHSRLKPLRAGLSPVELINLLGLAHSAHKYIHNFSSGMRQRVKLGLAIYTDAKILLLDEPTTNLDSEGVAWYLEHVQANSADRILVICSNSEPEYSFCKEHIRIQDYQKIKTEKGGSSK